MLIASGTTEADPLKSVFSTNGAGYDRLLDSLKISITPANSSSSNIEIAVKQKLVDGAQPIVIQFVSSSTSVASLPSIDSSTLVTSGTSALIADFLKNLSACYALPLTERVNPAGTGTAADITATACKTVFFGNLPSSFKSNGNVVGLGKAFNGIYTSSGTGTIFSQGSYEFTRGNGDLVIGYRSRDVSGNEVFDTFAVRSDTDGKLKLIGNQYAYPGGVSAYQQYRQFITLSQTAYNYYSTGYSFSISDVKGGSGVGNSIFNRVVVTLPDGTTTVTLKPSIGSGNLNLVLPNTSVSGTSYIRLRSTYANSATIGHPSTKDTNLFFAQADLTDSEIGQLPANSVWRFDYFLAGNTSSTPDGVPQYYKTRSRALTIAELKQKGLAELAPAVIAYQQANTVDGTTGQLRLPTTSLADGIDFTVPTGALPVTGIKIFGKLYSSPTPQGPSTRFDDAVTIGSTARTGTVRCAPSSGNDLHCSTTVSGAFASGAYTDGIHLYSKDSGGREYANFYAAYKLN
ncbi:MAG: hypothetical protein ABIP46_04650 [Polaromonas sp.]